MNIMRFAIAASSAMAAISLHAQGPYYPTDRYGYTQGQYYDPYSYPQIAPYGQGTYASPPAGYGASGYGPSNLNYMQYQTGQSPVQRTDVPPLSEEIVQAYAEVLAYSFEAPGLRPDQMNLLRQSLQMSWQTSRADQLNQNLQGTLQAQQLIRANPPQAAQMRVQWRILSEGGAAANMMDPMSQVIQQLAAQCPPRQLNQIPSLPGAGMGHVGMSGQPPPPATSASGNAWQEAMNAASQSAANRSAAVGELLSGTHTAVNPTTGESYTVQSGSNYYYQDPTTGAVTPSDTAASAGSGLTELESTDPMASE